MMRSSARILRLLSIVALALCVVVPLGSGPAVGQTPIALKILTGLTLGARAALYAQSAGIFRKYGLDVDIIASNSGSAGLSAVLGGSAQVVYLNSVTLVEAAARGVNLQVVAPGAYYTTNKPYALLIVRKDSPIHTARDLSGKIIAASALKDINAICTLGWIDMNGGDSKSVKTIEVPNSFLMPALDDGRIDATTILPPFQTEAIASGKYRVLGKPYDAIAKNFELAVWVASGTWAAQNPEAVRRFAAAMREASTFANANPLKAVDVVSAFTKIDPAIVARSVGPNDPPYVDPADLQPVIDVSLKDGIIDKTIDAASLLNPAVRKPGK